VAASVIAAEDDYARHAGLPHLAEGEFLRSRAAIQRHRRRSANYRSLGLGPAAIYCPSIVSPTISPDRDQQCTEDSQEDQQPDGVRIVLQVGMARP
jgi:hypothetical protein